MADGAVANRWVSFTDDEDTTWLFDLTFLLSDWRCTFGSGCQGTEPEDNGARGCCAHGAHLVDDEEREILVAAAERLSDAQWQNRSLIATDDDLFEHRDDEMLTTQIDDACVFLNDQTFAGGHGCALHIGAVAAGEAPMDWKPQVCWQLPFRFEEYEDAAGTTTKVLRAWRRSDWGEGGGDFGWWCTDHLTPANGDNATWINHQGELRALVGDAPIELLNDYLRELRGADSLSETAVKLVEKPT